MGLESCCTTFWKFKARRANFYVQFIVTMIVLAFSGYLIITYKDNATFTAGIALISSLLGYWLPSPTMVRKNSNKCNCEACKMVAWMAKTNSRDDHKTLIFPVLNVGTTLDNDPMLTTESLSSIGGMSMDSEDMDRPGSDSHRPKNYQEEIEQHV